MSLHYAKVIVLRFGTHPQRRQGSLFVERTGEPLLSHSAAVVELRVGVIGLLGGLGGNRGFPELAVEDRGRGGAGFARQLTDKIIWN